MTTLYRFALAVKYIACMCAHDTYMNTVYISVELRASLCSVRTVIIHYLSKCHCLLDLQRLSGSEHQLEGLHRCLMAVPKHMNEAVPEEHLDCQVRHHFDDFCPSFPCLLSMKVTQILCSSWEGLFHCCHFSLSISQT